jgi:prevent-host-death family protein
MRSIGIRELRQHASRYLRDAERGETIEITDRGRAVARLMPPAQGGAIEQLVATGRLRRAVADMPELAPLEPLLDAPLPSQTLSDNRADER